jgi:hypothetical protein
MSTIKTIGVEPLIHMRCYCHSEGCKRFHDEHITPGQLLLDAMASWEYKHAGHRVEYVMRYDVPRDYDDSLHERVGVEPWWLKYRENNNYQISFNASSTLTFTSLASLASDTNLLAGASSAVVDNGASAALLDLGLTAIVKEGTSPTVSTSILGYTWAKSDDSTYPDAITGSDATISATSTNVLNGWGAPWFNQIVDANSNRIYYQRPMSLQALNGGWLPRYWGVWFVQNTGVALASSGQEVTQKQSYIAG